MIKCRLFPGGCKLLYWSDRINVGESIPFKYVQVVASYLRVCHIWVVLFCFFLISITNFTSHACFVVVIGK